MNEELQNKIKKAATAANTQTQPQPQVTQQMTISELNFWLGDGFRKQDFDSEVFNLSEIFREKLQYLLFGKPLLIEKQKENGEELSEEEQKEVKNFIKRTKLQHILYANEGNVFDKGRGYVVIDKLPNGNVYLRLAEPSFPNTVTRLGTLPVAADIYTPFLFDKVKYYMRTTYTQDKIVNRMFTVDAGLTNPTVKNLKEIKIGKFNKNLPEQLHIQQEMENPYKFIPVVEFTYQPTYDHSWDKKDRLAPKHRIIKAQQLLNEGTKALRLELYLNRTKVLVDQDMINSEDKTALSQVAEAGILGILKDTGGIDGEGKQIEVIQGNPKVQEYWENISNILSLTSQSLKLSELSEGDSSSTATGEIFNKGNDVETANTLQIFRQEQISELITKMWAVEHNDSFTEDEIDTNEWSVQLIPNVIMNEAKMTEIVTQQLSAGLINMTQALAKLEGISTSDAKVKLSQDDDIYNPSLEAVSSFANDEGEDADSDKDIKNNNGKDVVEGK